ncbi:MAG TPA: PadR family transcriptional regulator [Gemmatimonadaceae bacterium]|jgi:transcriptional regulator
MTPDPVSVRQGTLDMLILKALSLEPNHGWGIGERIQQISKDVLQVQQGSLYPALHRLEARGLLTSEWRASEDNRKAKYYRLSPAGRRVLHDERADWERFMIAVQRVMEASS